MLNVWGVVVASLVLLTVISMLEAILIPKLRGIIGENRVRRRLSRLSEDSYRVLNDIMVNGEYGLTQIDHIVVSKYGIFVIETKNMKGKIYGSQHSKDWTKYSRGRKLEFENPTRQNYGHIKALEQITSLPQDTFHGIVVLAGSATLMFDGGENIVYVKQLIPLIKSYQTDILSAEQMAQMIEKITSADNNTDETRKEHLKQIKEKKNAKAVIDNKKICPKCGGELVMKSGKYGKFYGCSNYPSCKYTKKLH